MSDTHGILVDLTTIRNQDREESSSLGEILARISSEVASQKDIKQPDTNITPLKAVQLDMVADFDTWPSDIVFPLTPLECFYLLKGYAVRPKSGLTADSQERLDRVVDVDDSGYLKLK